MGSTPSPPAPEPHGAARETFGGMVMLLQALILFVTAAAVLVTPHSVCHVAANGTRRCGQSGEVAPVLALLAAAGVVLVVAVALLAHARWALAVAVGISALLTATGGVALAVSFADASVDDRRTYALLWVAGVVVAAIFAAPGPVLWPAFRRSRQRA